MSTEANKQAVRTLFESFGNLDKTAELESLIDKDNFVYYDTNPAFPRTYEGFLELRRMLTTAVPDQYTVIDELVAEGDSVIARHTHHGTQTGELFGIPPSGNVLSVPGIELFRFKDGKLIEFHRLDDDLGMLMQIGAIPGQGNPPS